MANKIKTIKVISPSRIHCCIINGLHAGEYIGGGIGFAIDEPSNELTVYMSDKYNNLDLLSEEHKKAMIVAVDRLTDFYKLPKISVSVERCLPNHAGFGSKTTLLLTLGFAYCKLFDLDFNLKNIFKILKRNSKSGVGSFAALYGGFIWENGFKSNIVTKDGGILPELQEHFYPNSDFKIVHFRFDNGEIFGEKEEKLIMDSKDASNEEIKKVKDSIKDLIIPSLKNGNEEELQKGIKIIEENGLKVYEWSQQSKKTLDFVEYYKKSKFPLSLGLSSWGPTMYFVTKHPKTAIDFINRYNINKPLHLQVSSIATEGFKFKEQYI